MKNSILTKFFTGYFSFAILGFLLISYWSNNLIYNHLLTNNINTLYKYASVIGSNAVDCVDNSLDDLDNPKQFLNDFNNVLDCDILILDSNRKPFYYTGTTNNLSKDSSNILIEKFKPDDYKNTHYKIGKFYNIFKTDTLSVVYEVKNNNKTYGYIVAHMPTSIIKKSCYDVTLIFYVTYAIILALSLIIFFNFMWFIYLPLKQIRLAAMEYAKGNFEYEGLKVNNDDEIGDVAHSLQYMSKQLNNSRAYQKEFISNISHVFRSPLTSIKGYIEAIMDGTIPPEDYNKYLRLTVSKSLLQDCVTLTVGTAPVLNLFLKTLIWNQLSLQQLILSRAVARRRILN